MGQYYHVFNLDKKQFLYPHKFDDGLKLFEFGFSGGGTMAALALLLNSDWQGDRIAVVGDYNRSFHTERGIDIGKYDSFYDYACETYEDISYKWAGVDGIRRDDNIGD